VALPDGSRLGFAGTLLKDWVLEERSGLTSRTLGRAGRFSAFAWHDGTVYAGDAEGHVVAFLPQHGPARATAVGDIVGRVGSICVMPDGRVLVGGTATVTLLQRDGGTWRTVDVADVTPNIIPVFDVVDDGRWLVVGRTPKVFLFALKPRGFVLVQATIQHKGGVDVVDGRAFLYGDGRDAYEYDEILNLREVYHALG
jgi:hypothetical protein